MVRLVKIGVEVSSKMLRSACIPMGSDLGQISLSRNLYRIAVVFSML